MIKLAIGGAAVAVLALVAVAVLALGSGQSSLARAAERLDGQNVRTQIQLGVSEDGEDWAMSGPAVMDAEGSRIRMDAKMTSGDDPEAIERTLLMIGDEIWVGGKGLEQVLPEGKRWIHSVDTSGASNTMTMSEFASFLKDADEIEDKGETDIRGIRVTHYAGQVNAREVAKETGGKTAKRFADLLGDRDLFIPVEAWIDDEGRPQRLSATMDAGGNSMSYTADILEYGVPVDVQPPPKDEWIEEEEFDELTGG